MDEENVVPSISNWSSISICWSPNFQIGNSWNGFPTIIHFVFLMPNVNRHVTEYWKHISTNVWRSEDNGERMITTMPRWMPSAYAKELDKSLSMRIPHPEDGNCCTRSSVNMLNKVGERILPCFVPLNIPNDWLCDTSKQTMHCIRSHKR